MKHRSRFAVILYGLIHLAPKIWGEANPAMDATPVAGCERRVFGQMPSGASVNIYTLTNGTGMVAKVMDLGATLTELWVPDAAGKNANVVLGFDQLPPYLERPAFLGATIGRFANRIGKASFELGGKRYDLPTTNGGPHHLHGGNHGFDKQVWSSRIVSGDEPAVEFSYTSRDGEEGYPGTLQVKVTYTLTKSGVLSIAYQAETDQPTPVNLTNHSFFNLAGSGTILNHRLRLAARQYTPVDAQMIPTGEILPVVGTPLDFTEGRRVGDSLENGAVPSGYDHNFVLDAQDGVLALAASLVDPTSKRVMSVWTTEPGVQFNTGNRFNGRFTSVGGSVIQKHSGLALETQHYPDSVNRPQFPSTILMPGKTFRSKTELRFSVDQ
jgi:aldose 1-epimerase